MQFVNEHKKKNMFVDISDFNTQKYTYILQNLYSHER